MAKDLGPPPPSAAVLPVVRTIRARIPGWQRALAAGAVEAGNQTPGYQRLEQLLTDVAEPGPAAMGTSLQQAAEREGTTPQASLGDHAALLEQALNAAGNAWQRSLDAAAQSDREGVVSDVQVTQAALGAAMQHALFVTFADDVRNGHTGESRGIDDYCQGWGLSTAEVNTLWFWLLQDTLEFDGAPLPVVLDSVNRRAYKKTENTVFLYWTAAMPLVAGAAVFGLIALLFELLNAAGVTTWPRENWAWKMLVLVLFVALGALAHVGAQALNIKYDDPMKVYDAGNIIDWLSLRWIAVIRMYVPVAVVAASLWGAGNIPTSFQKLGTAILAGYSADSFVRAAVSKLGTQSKQAQTTGG